MVLPVNGMVLSGFVGKNGKIIFRSSSPPVTDQEVFFVCNNKSSNISNGMFYTQQWRK